MTRLADWLPEPLTVPTRIARSLMVGVLCATAARAGASSNRGEGGWHDVLATKAATPRAPRDQARVAQATGSRRASNHNKLEDLGRERRSLLLSPSHSAGASQGAFVPPSWAPSWGRCRLPAAVGGRRRGKLPQSNRVPTAGGGNPSQAGSLALFSHFSHGVKSQLVFNRGHSETCALGILAA